MAIEKLLRNKSHIEKSYVKSQEISKHKHAGIFESPEHNVRVEIIGDVIPIEANGQTGVQVFARAWRDGKQLGFGQNGTVEIERFRIFNPPILVPDSNGTIFRDETNLATKVVTKKYFREDPVGAVRQSIAHTITLIGKDGGNIVLGKIGNTVDTFYPVAGANSPVDGTITRDVTGTPENFATIRGAGSGTSASDTITGLYSLMFGYTNDNGVTRTYQTWARSIVCFDTSTLGAGATISSATFSLYTGTDRLNQFTGGARAQAIVGATPASTATLATSDYSQLNTTLMASTLAISSVTSNAYNDFALNADGLANISKTGVSKFGLRTEADRSNTEQTFSNPDSQPYEYVNWASADTTGTSQDPKLVVTYTTSVDITVSPSAVTGSFATSAPTITGTANVTATALSGSFATASPAVSGDANITATALAGTFSMPTPDVQTPDAYVTPSAITGTFSMPNPVVVISEIGVTVIPSPITAVFSLPSSVVTTVRHITVSPSAVTGTFSTPSRIITADKWQNKFTTAGGTWNNKY